MEVVFHVPLVVAGHVEGLVDRRDVQHYQPVDVNHLLHRGHHHRPAAHAVAGEADGAEVAAADQPGEVTRHQVVSHVLSVRRIPVIPSVHCQDSPPCSK